MGNVKVGSIVYIPINGSKFWKGIIERINDNVDPRLKYKVYFPDHNIVMFFTEETIRRCVGN